MFDRVNMRLNIPSVMGVVSLTLDILTKGAIHDKLKSCSILVYILTWRCVVWVLEVIGLVWETLVGMWRINFQLGYCSIMELALWAGKCQVDCSRNYRLTWHLSDDECSLEIYSILSLSKAQIGCSFEVQMTVGSSKAHNPCDPLIEKMLYGLFACKVIDTLLKGMTQFLAP